MDVETTTTGNLDGIIDGMLKCKYGYLKRQWQRSGLMHPQIWVVFPAAQAEEWPQGALRTELLILTLNTGAEDQTHLALYMNVTLRCSFVFISMALYFQASAAQANRLIYHF